MINKAFATENPKSQSQKPVSMMELLGRPVNEIDPVLKDEEKGSAESASGPVVREINAINKGSKLTGNLFVTKDVEITGDVEGDITGEENANIFIKGSCKGNIRTKGGSVEVDGEMSGGDILAGKYVKITGKFHGGKIQAKEKIHINGDFSGTLESSEIEVGSCAKCTGEIVYREFISIQKGARLEGKITRIQGERKPEPVKKEDVAAKKGFFSKK